MGGLRGESLKADEWVLAVGRGARERMKYEGRRAKEKTAGGGLQVARFQDCIAATLGRKGPWDGLQAARGRQHAAREDQNAARFPQLAEVFARLAARSDGNAEVLGQVPKVFCQVPGVFDQPAGAFGRVAARVG